MQRQQGLPPILSAVPVFSKPPPRSLVLWKEFGTPHTLVLTYFLESIIHRSESGIEGTGGWLLRPPTGLAL